jgi:hypothetical protein
VRSSEWHPLSGLEYTGRLDVWLPAAHGGAIVFYIGDAVWLDIEAVLPGGVPLLITRERRDSVLAPDVPPDYWLDDGIPWRAPPRITRVRVEAAADRERAFTLALGRRAPRVVARLSGYPPHVRALVCARPIVPGEVYFATGWYGRERDEIGQPLRWMREHGAVIVSAGRDGPVRVRVRARPAAGVREPVLLTMTVNEVFAAPALEMRAGFADYVWEVPDRAWVPGANELLFEVSRTIVSGHRTLGMALASVAVE